MRFLPFGRSYFVVDTLYIGCEKFPQHYTASLNIAGVLYFSIQRFKLPL